MLNKLKTWLMPSIFNENPDKTRAALLVNIFLNIFLVGLPILFANTVFSPNIPRMQMQMAVIFCLWFAILWVKRILHSGKIVLSGTALVGATLTGVTLVVINIGTIRSPATSFYLFAILISGMIINQRALIWTAMISGALITSLLFAEINGLLPEPDLSVSITQGIALLVLIIMVTFLEYMMITSINEALERIRQELAGRALDKEHEIKRRIMMEKVVQIGKAVTEQTSDLRATLLRIWNSVQKELDFDRVAIFLYDPNNNMMQGSYGTNRSGNMAEEWNLKYKLEGEAFFLRVIERPDGFYFTQDYAGERNLAARPGHPMQDVKYYAAVAVWANSKPTALICVDQLISDRIISEEQQEALRLFAGYAGLAIENTRLNAELKERAQERENFIHELGNRNAELERFTYTVSHDLRSPLVTIKGFLGMLNKDIHENKSDLIQSDIQRIAGATEKMDALLTDLLKLSRIGRVMNPPEAIELEVLIKDAMESLDARIRTQNVKVSILPDLPTIQADRIRLREVLENLIDNAAKYMGSQPSSQIEIGAYENNGEQIIFVKDNGMGIDPQFHSRVFSLFEKLNPSSEGTGIGLALVKRIIEVHNGRIWVESDGVGKGSTFCFTIPNAMK